MDQRYHRPSSLPRAILILLGAALFFDIPASRAYNEHSAWTAILGRFLFHGVAETTGIPISFTLFEVLSYAFAGLILIRWGTQKSRLWMVLSLCAALIPAVCIMATFIGTVRGNKLALAFSQLHFVPMIPVWLVIGYYLGTQKQALMQALRILFWVCLWRSVYALYVFVVIYGGKMGTREYLIDHASSAFLAAGIAYALFQAFVHRHDRRPLMAYGAALALMLGPYYLNDRRTSFIAFMAAALLLPMILPKRFQRRMRSAFRWVVILGVLAMVYKVAYSKVRGAGAGEANAGNFEQVDYRQIENYNLMIGVIERPLLGLGFGTRFPQAVALPDISFSFDLFDAIPHNTTLFLWTFAGPLGIAGLGTTSCFLMLVIARVGSLARRRQELLLACIGLVVLVQWIMYVSFDMGLLESRASMLVGVFAGGLFPVYGRILVEQAYAKYQKPVRAHSAAVRSPSPPAFGMLPSFQWQRPQARPPRTHLQRSG